MQEITIERKKIKNVIEKIEKIELPKKSKKNDTIKKYNTIALYDRFFLNEIITYEKVKKIPHFHQKYFIMENFSPIKIGDIHQEQSHLENYEDLTNQMNMKVSYVLVTYPFTTNIFSNWNHFFSNILDSFHTNRQISVKTFFHYFFSSYFTMVDHFILLNKNGIYPMYINGESIFFNRDKVPILTLPICYHKTDKEEKANLNIDLLLVDLSFLPIEFHILDFLEREKKIKFWMDKDNPEIINKLHHCTFKTPTCGHVLSCKDVKNINIYTLNENITFFENKTKDEINDICQESIITVNNFQLSLLYLNLLDKIIEKSNIPFTTSGIHNRKQNNKWIEKIRESFLNVVNSNYKERENLEMTKEKIENLFS